MSLPRLDNMPVSGMVLHPVFGDILTAAYKPSDVAKIEEDITYTWYQVEQQHQNVGLFITAELHLVPDSVAVRSYPIFLQ